jgi:hypothetical protein
MAEKIVEKFESIGLSGPTIGNLTINEKGLEWRSATSTKIVQVGATRTGGHWLDAGD